MLGFDSPRLYFAVPTLYTIGLEFPDYDTAAAYALTTIVEVEGVIPVRHTRAWVIARLADRTGDREVGRWEITVSATPPGHDSPATFTHQRGPAPEDNFSRKAGENGAQAAARELGLVRP